MGPAANVGLGVVIDLSWEHERGFHVGLWALAGNVGLFVGHLGLFPRKLEEDEGLDTKLIGSWQSLGHR